VNRFVTKNLEGVTPTQLPPNRREGPVRALFISGVFLGFGNYYRMLREYTAQREDIDAVHVELHTPLWLKVAAKSAPFPTRGWDFHALRYLWLTRPMLRRWVFGPLDICERFDVVHVITQGNALWTLDLKKRCPRVKVALNVDGTAQQDVDVFGFSGAAKAPFVRAERRMFDAADLIVTRNAWCTGSLRSDYGLPDDKIHVARSSFKAPRASRLDRPMTPKGEKIKLVFVGNAWERKGGPQVVRVHQQRLADRCELHVFSKAAPRDESAKNVVWHDVVPRERLMNELLPSMDVFVMPTKVDQLPWSVLEASSVGLPVVTTAVGAVPEVAVDGETGLIVPPEDDDALARAIERLIDDPALRERLGRAGRERVEREFNPDVNFNGLIDRLIGLVD
jgi:glycosyltransferase involved in cell wall biosynthesis